MKAIHTGEYRSKKSGNLVFTYNLDLTEEQREAYQADKGEYYLEDDVTGKPLFFSNQFLGKQVPVIKTEAGKFILDGSMIEKAASIANSAGGAVADAIAKQLMAGLGLDFGNSTAAETPVSKPNAVENTVEEDIQDGDAPF